jgi:WD40 repeat protein
LAGIKRIDLVRSWEFPGGSDWITSIDLIKGKYIFVGSRDGTLHALNWYGAPIYTKHYGSWIGALKVLGIQQTARSESSTKPYILLGTKRGDIKCEELVESAQHGIQLKEIFSYRALNTVREIDITADIREAGETWITVGSEDRNVYVGNFGALLEGTNKDGLRKISVNGWIRSAAFCTDVENETTLIAAGCGDKHLYIFTLEGEQYDKIFVDSKIHSIVSDQRSSKLYCTSDAKKLYVVGLQGKSYGIISETSLPHRATKLAFMDDEFKKILVVCEDFNIYIFDTNQREIVSGIRVGQRVFAIKDASWGTTDTLLLGQAHGKLSAFMYSPREEVLTPTPSFTIGLVRDFDSTSLTQLAEAVLYGPKSQSIEVGIGRFLHVVPVSEFGPPVCIVGTDGGNVVVIGLEGQTDEQSGRRILYRSQNPLRVWSVFGYWEHKGHLRLFVATSEEVVLQYTLQTDVNPPVLVERPPIPLEDWPREIRPVSPFELGGEIQLLISCENGDLIVHGNAAMKFNTGQILRTGYAKQIAGGEYLILVGSDNNLITFYRNQKEWWRKETLDKVREVLITEDGCLAASEDRYLYVLSQEGRLKFRYRFPHRALCIDRYFDHKKNVWFVVGCGDGFVYFVNEHGYIREAYEFPDRIRDVKIFNNEEMIVACEDRNIYFAPTSDKLFVDHYGDKQLDFIEHYLTELQAKIHSHGLIEVNNIPENDRLLLLMYANEWFKPANVDLLVSLLDSSRDVVGNRDSLRLYYIYASALIVLATRGNFAAGKSRIEEYIDNNSNNCYALHSIIVTITQSHIRSRRPSERYLSSLVAIDTIVTRLPFDDSWILEECVRHLFHAGFFQFSEDGFCRFFETVQMEYNKLTLILDCALKCEHSGVESSEMVSLVRFLRSREVDFDKFVDIFGRLPENTAAEIKECLRELNLMMSSDEDTTQILIRLQKWIEPRVRNQPMRKICIDSIAECLSGPSLGQLQFSLIAQLMENKLIVSNCSISASDYLHIMFCSSFMWILSARFDSGAASDDNGLIQTEQ